MGTPCCMGIPLNPALYNCDSEYTLLYKDSGNKIGVMPFINLMWLYFKSKLLILNTLLYG